MRDFYPEDVDHEGYLGHFSALGEDFAEISNENFAGCSEVQASIMRSAVITAMTEKHLGAAEINK